MSEVKEDSNLIPVHPLEASMSGRNSVYRFCEQRGQSASYAVCLHTIRRIEANDLPAEIAVECQRGYCHNNCVAKVMRAEEVAAGHALYFIPRPEHITNPKVVIENNKPQAAVSSGKYDMNDPSYARGWAIGGGSGEVREQKKPVRQAPVPVKPKKPSYEVSGNMADVVNVLMKENAENKAKPAKEVPAPVADQSSLRPLPGESTADFIKRRAAMKVAK